MKIQGKLCKKNLPAAKQKDCRSPDRDLLLVVLKVVIKQNTFFSEGTPRDPMDATESGSIKYIISKAEPYHSRLMFGFF